MASHADIAFYWDQITSEYPEENMDFYVDLVARRADCDPNEVVDWLQEQLDNKK